MNKPDGIFDKLGGFFKRKPATYDTTSNKILTTIKWVLIVTILAIPSYYIIGGFVLTHTIYDDTNVELDSEWRGLNTQQPGSEAIARMIQLMERETITNDWVPNDPWFFSTILLDNMPNYQRGLISAVSRVSIEFQDRLARHRGSSEEDSDLAEASNRFKISPNLWAWDPSVSWLPQATAETHYITGIKHLRSYNSRLAAGTAVYDTRADSLIKTLERITNDLGSSAAVIDRSVDEYNRIGWFDTDADDVFYGIKGRLYGYCMIMKGFRQDFDKVIIDKNVNDVWNKMEINLCEAARLDPWVISNGDRESSITPSHLSAQGFDLIRARSQLFEVIDVLLK